jgi:hypothetical protein
MLYAVPTGQAMHVERNIEALSLNHCCSGKAISITYSKCVCSHSYQPCNAYAPYCNLWPVLFYSNFPNYLIKVKILEKKNY